MVPNLASKIAWSSLDKNRLDKIVEGKKTTLGSSKKAFVMLQFLAPRTRDVLWSGAAEASVR